VRRRCFIDSDAWVLVVGLACSTPRSDLARSSDPDGAAGGAAVDLGAASQPPDRISMPAGPDMVPANPRPSDTGTSPTASDGAAVPVSADTAVGPVADASTVPEPPDPSPPPTGCASAQTNCGGACVDLTRDKDQCGACGHSCLVDCVGGSCTCAQKSAGNLIRNAGFDSDAKGWTSEPHTTVTWVKEDAAGCAGSGAMLVRTTGLPDNQSEQLEQCIPVRPGTTYNYGVWRKEADPPRADYHGFLSLFWYRDADCKAQLGYENSPEVSIKGVWNLHEAKAVAPAGAAAVTFVVGVVGSHAVTYDMPYLTPASGRF
jgi:hypothetical protein